MTPEDSLAAYRFPLVEPRYFRDNDPRRTWRPLVTDHDGERHGAAIPSPAAMAEAFARPLVESRLGPVHRLPGGTLTTDLGERVHHDTIRDLVLEGLLALPARPGLGPYDAYTGVLRVIADESHSGLLRRYAGAVAKACARHGAFPAPPAERPPARPPRTAKTPAQWKADQRARDRAAETQSARAWLELFLAEAEPGTVAAADLHALAEAGIQDVIDELLDADEAPTHEDGTPWRAPGPRTFYAIADEVVSPRHRAAKGVQTYTINAARTEETAMPANVASSDDALAEALLERMARLAWEEQREVLRSYLERRDVETPTDAPVTDLGAFRRRRAA